MGQFTLIALNLIAISALLWFFDYPYRQFRIDHLRISVFRARDGLFMAAQRGIIPFDHPAYGVTRLILNGMIQFAHDVSLWRIAMLLVTERWWSSSKADKEFFDRYNEHIRSLSPRARVAVIRALAEAHLAVTTYILHTSLLTFPIVLVLKVALRTVWRVKRLARTVDKAIPAHARRVVDHGAYLIGECMQTP